MSLSRRALVASLALAPFATASQAADEPLLAPRPPGPDEALVYVYRQWAFKLGGRDMMVRIDEVKAVKLGTAQYSWLYLKAGDYRLAVIGTLEMGLPPYPPGTPMAFDGGTTHYFELKIREPMMFGGFAADLRPVVESMGLSGIRGEWKRKPEPLIYRPPEAAIAQLGATDR